MSGLLYSAEFWVLVAFVILVGGLFNKVRVLLNGALDSRAERIKAQLDEAQKLREDAQSLLAEYQRKQNAAADDAKRIVDHAKAEAERIREQAQADLEQALKRREQLAIEKISQALREAESRLADPDVYQDLPPDQLDQLLAHAGKLRRSLEHTEQDWLAACEALERLTDLPTD